MIKLKAAKQYQVTEYLGRESTSVASFYIHNGDLEVEYHPRLAKMSETEGTLKKGKQIVDFVQSMGIDTKHLLRQRLATIYLNHDGVTLHGVSPDNFIEIMEKEEIPQLGLLMMDIVEPFLTPQKFGKVF